MMTQKDPKDVADEFAGNLSYLHTLLAAAEDKVRFYLSSRELLGPHWEVLTHHAQDIEGLLMLTEQFVDKMDRDMDTVTGLLYEMEPVCTPQ